MGGGAALTGEPWHNQREVVKNERRAKMRYDNGPRNGRRVAAACCR
ncbi:hypothetical protein GCM10020358_26400 [Amorphoplanes nipponensis]